MLVVVLDLLLHKFAICTCSMTADAAIEVSQLPDKLCLVLKEQNHP